MEEDDYEFNSEDIGEDEEALARAAAQAEEIHNARIRKREETGYYEMVTTHVASLTVTA